MSRQAAPSVRVLRAYATTIRWITRRGDVRVRVYYAVLDIDRGLKLRISKRAYNRLVKRGAKT